MVAGLTTDSKLVIDIAYMNSNFESLEKQNLLKNTLDIKKNNLVMNPCKVDWQKEN